MRNVVASSVLSLLVLSVPAVASATEVSVAAPVALSSSTSTASVPETRDEFEHRLQLTLGAEGNDAGMGLRVGLGYRFVELQLGVDTDVFDERHFIGLNVRPLPGELLSPYLYGRIGGWSRSQWEPTPDLTGSYGATGVGVDLNVFRHAFVYGEVGVGNQTGGSGDGRGTGTFVEGHLGIGIRL